MSDVGTLPCQKQLQRHVERMHSAMSDAGTLPC